MSKMDELCEKLKVLVKNPSVCQRYIITHSNTYTHPNWTLMSKNKIIR